MKMNEISIIVYEGRTEINMPGFLIIGNSLKDALSSLKEMSYPAYEDVVAYINKEQIAQHKEVVLAK